MLYLAYFNSGYPTADFYLLNFIFRYMHVGGQASWIRFAGSAVYLRSTGCLFVRKIQRGIMGELWINCATASGSGFWHRQTNKYRSCRVY